MANKCVVCSESKCLYPAYDKEEVDELLKKVEVKDKGITTAKIADKAVTNEKMASDAVYAFGQYTLYENTSFVAKEINIGFKPKLVKIFDYISALEITMYLDEKGNKVRVIQHYRTADADENQYMDSSVGNGTFTDTGFKTPQDAKVGAESRSARTYTYIAFR